MPMNKLFAVLLLLMLGALPVQAQFVVEVTRGQSEAIPIAIVPFAPADVTAGSFDVAQLVSEDLARSGRFRTMDRKDMIEQPHSGANVNFDDWKRLNNDYMVVGTQTMVGDHYQIVFEIYNVLTRQRMLGYQINANKPGLRVAAHQVADVIFEKILGICGASTPRSPISPCWDICQTAPIN